MALVDAFVCTECGRSVSDGGPTACPTHGATAAVEVRYDDEHLASTMPGILGTAGGSLWQFEPVLPTGPTRVRLGAGGTPLLRADSLSGEFGVTLWLKDETVNPTGSVKDRASAVVISRAATSGTVVSCASTGNQAASIAAYAARAGLDCRVFVPGDVPEGKAVQPLVSGADVYAVDGDYDDAVVLCRQLSDDRGWHDCSPGVDPFGREGLRTVGLELAARDETLDWVVVPMGNGTTIAAIWKGLRECRDCGVLDRTPRLLGVQPTGADAIHEQFTGESSPAETTAADSIDVGRPYNDGRACEAMSASDGTSVVVTDEAMIDAERTLGRDEGIYVEPASAATLAGLRRAIEDGIVEHGANVACVLTGSGLKDTDTARTVSGDLKRIPAEPGSIPEDG